MASLQPCRVKGHTYWRIVESRRVNGKPRAIPVAYLGRADDILARLQTAEQVRVSSRSHGAVCALWHLAQSLDLATIIDRQLRQSGRRLRGKRPQEERHDPAIPPVPNDGLSVGQSLVLVAIGRACHATSKRGFSDWAATTTLGELAGVDVSRLSSQHFWDQMDQVPVSTVSAIEQEIVQTVLRRFEVSLDTLLYDATNFYTFISTKNQRPTLPARGHNKQKRNDLRQVSVALLCTRRQGIPLWHVIYAGQVSDARSFEQFLPAIRARLLKLKGALDGLTVVYDKGNVSRANLKQIDELRLHYVTGLTVSSQEKLVEEANPRMAPNRLENGEIVPAYRTKKSIWGKSRTAVVLVSETLRNGQMQGILQHVASAEKWLKSLAETLARGKQRRSRATIERDIQTRLKGRQHLQELLHVQLSGEDPRLHLSWEFDQSALETLNDEILGRLVIITDRHDWTTAEIIQTYRSQARIEAVFGHLKDPEHVALRPQHHWTDQKLHVHVFTCVLGHLLTRLLHLRAQGLSLDIRSPERLLDELARIRLATVIRGGAAKKPRVSTQLEKVSPELTKLLPQLGIAGLPIHA